MIGLDAVSSNGEDFVVNWDAPVDDGGSDVTFYNVTSQVVGIGNCNDTFRVRKSRTISV